MKKLLLLSFGTLLLASCGNNEEKKTEENISIPEVVEETKTCTYTYEPGSVEILWKAYKYTEQVGVNGGFKSFDLSGAKEASSPAEAINGASAKIDTKSVDSGDPTRDPKIVEFFFSTLENGETLNATISNFNESSKTVDISINMNGQTQLVSGSFEVVGNKLEAQFEMDVTNWGASIDKLNEVCEDLHKGADGKSILWPNVTIYLIANFNETCV